MAYVCSVRSCRRSIIYIASWTPCHHLISILRVYFPLPFAANPPGPPPPT